MSTKDQMHAGHRQRLKQRYIDEGLDNFNQINVLELLLFYCVQRKDTNPLAHRLLDHFGGLGEVLDASVSELMQVRGVTEHIATFLSMISDLNRYCQINLAMETKILNTTSECCKYVAPFFVGRKNETVFLLCMDAKCKVLCCKLMGEGSVNSANVSIRKIVETAMKCNASSVIVAHNHPTGLALPSEEDVQTTVQLNRALRLMGIVLADHIIVADGECVSMVQSGIDFGSDYRR